MKAVQKRVSKEIGTQRPQYRYAFVQSINPDDFTVRVINDPNDPNDQEYTVTAGGADMPTETGIKVRVDGVAGDRYISGIVGQATGANVVLIDNQVENNMINDDAVDTRTLAPDAVTEAEINDEAITSAKLADGSVVTVKLGDLAVSTAKIVDDAISQAKIADAAVGTPQIANLAVTTALIDNLAVSNAKIADLTITGAKIGNAAIGDAKISDLTAAKITAGTLSAAVILSGSIGTATTGARVVMDGTGIKAFNSSGTNTLTVASATGAVTMVGSLTSGSTITGATIQTATTGARVSLDSTGLKIFNSGGTNIFQYLTATSALSMSGTLTVTGTISGGTISGSTVSGATVTGGTITGTSISGGTITGATFSTTQSAGDLHIEIVNGVNRNRITWVPPTAGFSGGATLQSNAQLFEDSTDGFLTIQGPYFSGLNGGVADPATIELDPAGNIYMDTTAQTGNIPAGGTINLEAHGTGSSVTIGTAGGGTIFLQTGTSGFVQINSDDFYIAGTGGVVSFHVDPANEVSIGGPSAGTTVAGSLTVTDLATFNGNVNVPASVSIQSGNPSTKLQLAGGVRVTGGIEINGGITTPSGSGASTYNTSVTFNNTLTVGALMTMQADIQVNTGNHVKAADGSTTHLIVSSPNGNIGWGVNQNAGTATIYAGGGVVSHIGTSGAYQNDVSSGTLKKFVKTDNTAHDLVDRIRYVNYRLKAENKQGYEKGRVYKGVIAEELHKHSDLQHFVAYRDYNDAKKRKPMGVDYAGLALAAAMSVNQKLNRINKELTARIEKLERLVAA